MARKEFAKLIINKCEKLLASRDLDYVEEEELIQDKMVFKIYCDRIKENVSESAMGLPIELEFCVEKHGIPVEAVIIDMYHFNDYEEEVDYILRCVTDWE